MYHFFILNRLAEEEPRGPWNRIEDVAPKLSREDRPGRGGNAGRGGRRDTFGGNGWDRPGMSGGGPGMNFGGNFGGPPMGFVQSNQNNWGNGQGFGGPPQNQNWNQQQNQGGWGSQQNNPQQGWQSTGGWSSQGQQNPGW